jgi:type II secretory pathway component PulJ
MALLEVLVAITIFAIAALGWTQWLSGGSAALVQSRLREQRVADEDRLLSAHVLLDASDFDLRLGTRQAGKYWMSVARPEPGLYRLAVSSQPDAPEDLVTVVYRPHALETP